MQLLCFLQPLGIQPRKRRDDEEHNTEMALPLIQTDKPDNAVLHVVEQGISATLHIINIISAAVSHHFFAGN